MAIRPKTIGPKATKSLQKAQTRVASGVTKTPKPKAAPRGKR